MVSGGGQRCLRCKCAKGPMQLCSSTKFKQWDTCPQKYYSVAENTSSTYVKKGFHYLVPCIFTLEITLLGSGRENIALHYICCFGS